MVQPAERKGNVRKQSSRRLARRPQTPSSSGWLGGVLPLENETAWFLLVNALDIVLTWMLLYRSATGHLRDSVVETNPVAAFFLNRWGLAGMNYFKLGVVTVVIVLTQLIALRRPETARVLLRIGTLIVGGVVIYSMVLYAQLSGRL